MTAAVLDSGLPVTASIVGLFAVMLWVDARARRERRRRRRWEQHVSRLREESRDV